MSPREPGELRPEERRWIEEFSRAVAGDYNALTIAIPPRVRFAIKAAMEREALSNYVARQAGFW